MRTEPGQRLSAVFSPARQFGGVRPPMIGGLVAALVLIGVIVWLAISGGREDGETAGTQLRIRLSEPETGERAGASPSAPKPEPKAAPAATKAPAQETAPEPKPAPQDAVEKPVSAAPMVSEGAAGPPLAAIDPVLLQPSSHGALPIVGPDGRRSWQAYARPFAVPEGTPRLAIVVAELGFNRETTEAAIRLPPEVTLSFSPYAPEAEILVAMARAAGHEVLLDLPMEPTSYPTDDPGPQTLLTSLSPTDNVERLETVLGRAQGYVGVISQMGSKFTTSPEALRPVLSVLAERGLMFVDGKTSTTSVAGTFAEQLKLPRALNDRFIDNEATRVAIDDGLSAVESEARRLGVAVGVGRPFPVTLQRLAVWLPTLKSRGIALAPITAVADRQKSQ